MVVRSALRCVVYKLMLIFFLFGILSHHHIRKTIYTLGLYNESSMVRRVIIKMNFSDFNG
jgi:hypothetical protein